MRDPQQRYDLWVTARHPGASKRRAASAISLEQAHRMAARYRFSHETAIVRSEERMLA